MLLLISVICCKKHYTLVLQNNTTPVLLQCKTTLAFTTRTPRPLSHKKHSNSIISYGNTIVVLLQQYTRTCSWSNTRSYHYRNATVRSNNDSTQCQQPNCTQVVAIKQLHTCSIVAPPFCDLTLLL